MNTGLLIGLAVGAFVLSNKHSQQVAAQKTLDDATLAAQAEVRRLKAIADAEAVRLKHVADLNSQITAGTAKHGRTPPAGGLGDIDGDGVVTEGDVVLALAIYSGEKQGTPDMLARGNVTGNGIGPVTALLIKRYVDGLIDRFPVQG